MNLILPILVPKDVEVVFASFGGVGTTFLMYHIAKYKQTNFPCDRDLLKHSPFPPISYNKNIRFVYVYGDPILATISLFRRKYHHWQIEKLTRYSSQDSSVVPETSLEEYAASKADLFQFRTHFYNWYDKYLVHPTMFIRYESIFDNIEPLINFLNLPKSAIDSFPAKKPRKSILEEVNSKTISSLTDIYGSFANELNNLEDIEIRYPQADKSLTKTYFSAPYPKIMLSNVLDFKMLARNNYFKNYKKLRKAKQKLLISNEKADNFIA